jgi:hypothetical protein
MKKLRPLHLVAALVVAILAVAGIAAASSGAGRHQKKSPAIESVVYINTVPGNPDAFEQQPARMGVDNSDFVRTLKNLRWSDWGKPEATATGTLVADSRMNGEGRLVKYSVMVVASRLANGEASQRYTRLVITAVTDSQGYPSTEEFALPGPAS